MTSVAPQQQPTSFLDPSVLARIGNLELLAKTVVEGFINGLHKSPHLGASTRLRRASRVHARRRHPAHRLAAVGAQRPVLSQGVRGGDEHELHRRSSTCRRRCATVRTPEDGRLSKLTYACYLAACLTYFSSLQRDRVGHGDDRPRHRRLRAAVGEASAARAAHARPHRAAARATRRSTPGKSTLLAPLRKLSETLRRRSLVVLISDFYEDPDEVISALSHVRGRGNDVMVFHLLDPREIDFSFTDASNFIDMETGDEDARHSRVSAPAVSGAREASTRRRCRSASSRRAPTTRCSTRRSRSTRRCSRTSARGSDSTGCDR